MSSLMGIDKPQGLMIFNARKFIKHFIPVSWDFLVLSLNAADHKC